MGVCGSAHHASMGAWGRGIEGPVHMVVATLRIT